MLSTALALMLLAVPPGPGPDPAPIRVGRIDLTKIALEKRPVTALKLPDPKAPSAPAPLTAVEVRGILAHGAHLAGRVVALMEQPIHFSAGALAPRGSLLTIHGFVQIGQVGVGLIDETQSLGIQFPVQNGHVYLADCRVVAAAGQHVEYVAWVANRIVASGSAALQAGHVLIPLVSTTRGTAAISLFAKSGAPRPRTGPAKTLAFYGCTVTPGKLN